MCVLSYKMDWVSGSGINQHAAKPLEAEVSAKPTKAAAVVEAAAAKQSQGRSRSSTSSSNSCSSSCSSSSSGSNNGSSSSSSQQWQHMTNFCLGQVAWASSKHNSNSWFSSSNRTSTKSASMPGTVKNINFGHTSSILTKQSICGRGLFCMTSGSELLDSAHRQPHRITSTHAATQPHSYTNTQAHTDTQPHKLTTHTHAATHTHIHIEHTFFKIIPKFC